MRLRRRTPDGGRTWATFRVLEDDSVYEQLPDGWRAVREEALRTLLLHRVRGR